MPRKTKQAASARLCAHCGREPATTTDHVFPQCLFLVQLNPPLLVPSCEQCNKGRGDGIPRHISADEDYFYKFLSVQDGTSKHPAAVAFLEGKIKRSFGYPKTGDRKLFSEQSRMLLAINEAGIVYPRPGFKVFWDRIDRVLTKMTRGLIYFHNEMQLPSNYRIQVRSALTATQFEHWRQLLTPNCLSIRVIGGNKEVQFIGFRNPEDWNETWWLMVFYQGFFVLSNTCSSSH